MADEKEKFRKILEIFSIQLDYVDLDGQVFVPSAYTWLFKAFDMMKLFENDIFYDLGSGDGRGLAIAKTFYNVEKSIGIENNPQLAEASRKNLEQIKEHGFPTDGIQIIGDNYLNVDVSDATSIYCYGDPYFDLCSGMLAKKFAKELKKTTKIIMIGNDILEPPFIGQSLIELVDVGYVVNPLFAGIYLYKLK